MIKALKIFFLLIIITLSLSYSFLYFSFNIIPPENTINSMYRKSVMKNHFLRKLLKLYQVGDARFEYANDNKFKKLNIIIYYQNKETLHVNTIQTVVAELLKIIKKPDGITVNEQFLDENINSNFSDKDIDKLIDKYSIVWKNSDTTTLQIFVLKKYNPHSTYAGLVKDAYNIFLFMDALRDVSDQQSSTENAEISTILHEFGHMLGAGHVEEIDCILTEKVENLTLGSPSYFTTTYCQSDLDEIEKALR